MARFATLVCVLLFMLLLGSTSARAQTTEFTYQGQLLNGGTPANGNFDFEFLLFDALAGGTQIGSTLTRPNVPVANGVFSISLNFGTFFPGAARWLEIRVKVSGGGALTPLTPRQPLTSSPYAIRSLSTATADVALTAAGFVGNLGGDVNGTQAATVVTSVGGQSAANVANAAVLSLTATSANSPNTLARRDASGDLSVNRLSALTQYNLAGNRILAAPGGENLYVGPSTGTANMSGTGNAFIGTEAGRDSTGFDNTFVGSGAGRANTGGLSNSYFGRLAGSSATVVANNSFFGASAGLNNTASGNSFFGSSAGLANTSGAENTFVGANSGKANSEGEFNSFFGADAGLNATGSGNSFFGRQAGFSSVSGSNNTAVGRGAGSLLGTGSNNTVVGRSANVSPGSLTYATAIGSDAIVTTSNTIMLGRSADTVIAPNLLRVGVLGAAGATPLCRNANNEISSCSSSLRYKTNYAPFRSGLSFIRQLRPISFDWKAGGPRDVGFGAEDVARIDPLFVTYNAAGQVEGVKYDRISVALVNATTEQQTQIEAQRLEIERLRSEIDVLKAHICTQTPTAAFCTPKN